MRNTSKMTTLENKFPLLAVEQGCIISKDADITVAFEVELPELYTVTGAEYEAIHGCWCKAIKVLPDFSIVHKQDWFIKEKYTPELQKEDMSFLSRSFERHFNERPYLKHTCYLYLTKTTKERNRMQSNFSTLCRGHIIPKELDKETAAKFMEAAEQFERIINDSGFVRLRRLSTDEIVGTDGKAGLIERYFSLMPEGDATLQDIDLSAREMRISRFFRRSGQLRFRLPAADMFHLSRGKVFRYCAVTGHFLRDLIGRFQFPHRQSPSFP